jgi:DASS family divalent anion:Na+ symporter
VLGYANWLLYASVPALLSLLAVPWLVYRWERPGITHTPEAADFARGELDKMGRTTGAERWLAGVFIVVCGLWIAYGSSPKSGIEHTTLAALGAVAVLLLRGVLAWDDLLNERGAWDVFIWYGGLVQLGKQLKETGLLSVFAQNVAGGLHGWQWLPLFAVILVVYFYAHYAFASITTHLVSMYPAFVAVLLATDAPPALVVCAFAMFANFSAGLTHYGTTPGPILFSLNYVPLATWWRVGFKLSVVNLALWLTFGMAWWKLLGLW